MESSVSAEDMVNFVQGLFKESPDIGTLTTREIRNSYLKKKNLETLSKEQNGILKTVIQTLLLEIRNAEEQKEPSSDVNGEGTNAESSVKVNGGKAELSPEPEKESGLSEPESSASSVEDDVANDDDEEEIHNLSRKSTKRKRVLIDSDSDSEEPSKEVQKDTVEKTKRRSEKKVDDSKIEQLLEESDTEEGHLSPARKKKMSSESEEEPLIKMKAKGKTSSESEEEPLIKMKAKGKSQKEVVKEDSSSDEAIGPTKKKKKKESLKDNTKVKPVKKSTQSANENKPPKKSTKLENKELKHLRSCCHAAGLFVRYDKVFVNCSTDKDKEQTLHKLLKEAGLKRTPTVEACKKLKLKREEKKALDDLDTANIITSSGRARRQNAFNNFDRPLDEDMPKETVSALKNTYSRLVGIVDSEESNSD